MKRLMSHRMHPSPADASASDQTDAELLRAVARDGSQRCFEILVARYAPMVLGVCRRRLHGEHDAEDAAQAVFLILWKKAGSAARSNSAAGWLHRVAQYVCRNLRRARVVRRKHEREAVAMRTTSTEGLWTQVALRETLDEELDRLPDKYRVPLILFHFQEKTLKEISELTNTNLSTLGTRLSRGRELLASRLSRRGIAVTGGTLAAALSSQAALAAAPASFVPATTQAAFLYSMGVKGGTLSTTASATATNVMKTILLAKVKVSAILGLISAAVLGTGIAVKLPHGQQQASGPAVHAAAPVPAFMDNRLYAGDTEVIAAIVSPVIALSADGRLLVVGEAMPNGAGRLRCWEIASGELAHERFEPSGVASVAVSPDGRQIAYGRGDHSIQVISTDRFRDQVKLRGHVQGILCLKFSPDGRQLASSGSDWTLRLWDVASGRRLAMAKTAGQSVPAISFDAAGEQIVSHSHKSALESWNWSGDSLERIRQVSLKQPPFRLAFDSQGDRAVVASDDPAAVTLVDSRSGQAATPLPFETDERDSISGLTISRDGQRAVAGTVRGRILVWNTGDGSVVATIAGDEGPVTRLASDAAGRNVATASARGGVSVWDVDSQELLRRLEEPVSSQAFADAVSFGGRFAALQRRASEIDVYETLSGRRLANKSVADNDVTVIAVSDEGERLVTGGTGGGLLVWDVAASTPPAPITAHSSPIVAVAVLPGEQIAVSADEEGGVCRTDLDGQKVLYRHKAHEGPIRCLAVTADGTQVLTAGEDGVIQLHDVGGTGEPRQLGRHDAPVTALACGNSTGALASADENGIIRIWRPGSGAADWNAETVPVKQWFGKPTESPPRITSLAISPHERTLVIGTESVPLEPVRSSVPRPNDDGKVEVVKQTIERQASLLVHYDLRGKYAPVRANFQSDITALAFPDNDVTLLVATADGSLSRRRGSLEPVQSIKGHEGGTRFVAYLPDGKRMISGGQDQAIRVWETATGKLFKTVNSGHGAVVCGAISPDGRTLVTSGYGKGIYFWDVETLRRRAAKFDHGGRIGGMAFSSDGKWLATASWDKTVKLWDVQTQRVARTLEGFTSSVCGVRFSPDGSLLAACSGDWTEWFSDGEVRLWETATGRLRFSESRTPGAANVVSFTQDGSNLMACSHSAFFTWDVTMGKVVNASRGSSGSKLFALLDGERTLVQCLELNRIQIVDLETGLVRARFAVRAPRIDDLEVSPQGNRFATATSGGEILIWEVE
jgi:RNA polymerase sigma factor (sigma-70 family)